MLKNKKMNKVVLSFCVAVLSFVAFGQNDPTAKKNFTSGPAGMSGKEYNYVSFMAPAKKEVIEELSKRTSDKLKNHPEYGVLPYNAPSENCYEILADRTATTRHYLKKGTNGSGFYNQAGAGPINYQDNNGNWRAIDPRMFPTDNANVFEAANQLSPTRIDLTKNEVSINNRNNVLSFNRNLKLYHQTEEGTKLVASADWSQATVGNDGARVKNIFPGINLEVYAINGGLKSSFIISSPLSYQEGYLLIEDEMKLPAGTALTTRLATKKNMGYEGMITVSDLITGNTLYEIGAAVGYDNSDHRINPTEKFAYRISGNNLSIAVPVKWMNTPGFSYPLVIDPLVTSSNTLLQGSIAGSGGNGSGTFNPATACPYTLVVPTPANCTITDVKFAFDYVAQNGAVKSEGAIDFLYGICRSPSTSTFYWFCNQATAGQCTTGVAGISMYTDIQSCIPAPQCAPYNMSFTMRFYDRFGGACSNTFIAANSNWTMFVEGHTLEFANPGTPFTVSANTVCFGQNINATFNGGLYGVPAYSVNWSFSPTGIPSVGSGNNPTITFPAPGAYTLYCIVTDACGLTQSANTAITVNPLPTVTATPAANPICLGQNTVLTASGATTYVWSANAGGGGGTTATVTPPLGTTVYTVTGTAAGCSNTATVSVTVNPIPVVTAVASPVTICAGQTATLTAGGATTYTWSANAGGVIAPTASVAPVVTDTYTVTGDALGCTATQTVTVVVNPPPTLTLTPSAATICAGAAATCTVTGATTYTWMPGNINAPTISVTPANTTTYVVTGDNAGCTSTGTFVVTVTPLPTLTVTAAPASICTGGTTTLTASGAATYTWSANSGGGNANPITVSPGSTTSYTLAGTQAGCSDSIVVSVTVGTQPTVSAIATNTTICSSQSTTLTASGATNYTWSPGGSANPITVSPNTTTTYTLIGDNGGCSDTTTVTVNVNPTPTVTAVANPTAICSGQTSTLTASGAATYTWSANAGGAIAATTTVSPNNTTTYTVTGDALGCTVTQTVTVTVTPTPTVIIISPSPTVCSGQTLPIIAGGATTYTWSANAGGVTTQSTTVTPVTNPTIYTVTGANGTCTGTATISIGVTATPTVTASANPAALCAGQSSTLTVSGATTYTWSANAGSVSSTTVAVTPAATTVYNVTGENAGCTTLQSVTVTVNPIPTLAAISSQTVCSGNNVNSINFTASAGAVVGWTNTNINIGVAASGTTNISGYQAPVVTTQQIGVITAIPADPITGCVGASQTFTIVINPKPVVTGPPLIDSAFCGIPTGDIKNLVVSGGTPNYAYQWYMGSVVVPGAAGTSLNLNGMPAGTYSFVVTDANMCTATAGLFVIGGTPAVVASFTANPISGTAPLNVTFNNNSTGAITYNWNLGNGSTPTTQNPNTIYTSGGTYTVVLIAHNGTCQSTDTLTIHVDQSISIVVPNIFSPNGDGINDDFGFITSGISSLSCDIFNRWGQKIKTLSSPTDKWDGKLDNGNTASEGTYFYVVVASSYDSKPHNSQGSLTIVK